MGSSLRNLAGPAPVQKIEVTREACDKIAELTNDPPKPTPALVELMRGHAVPKRFAGPKSPHDLIQEHYPHDPWKVLVCCFMLNQTSRKQLDQVIDGFFERWPDAHQLLAADPADVAEAIRSLGFKNRRTERLRKFSEEYAKLCLDDPSLPAEKVAQLHGVGPYALRAFQIFCKGELGDSEPEDGPLTKYWTWARENPGLYSRGWEG